MIENAAIARILAELADAGEIRGDNAFKIRALRNAAATIESLPFDVATLCREPGRLLEIKGVGPGIARKIEEICATGGSAEHRRLMAEFPPGLLELVQLRGIGPKRAGQIFALLGVRSVDELEEAARAGRLREVPRLSAAAEAKILQSIAAYRSRAGRFLLSWADGAAARLLEMLRSLDGVARAEAAGSLRRRRETVGDLDLLVACADPGAVMQRFCRAGETLVRGETKSSIRLASGIQVDLRVVPEESFGAALHYFTGSQAHNVAVRALGVRRGLTINEYGVFEVGPEGAAGRRLGGAREEDVFEAVGLPWIAPELREDRGEIEAARDGKLPRLIELADVRGDVHVHTTRTDGTGTIEEMARGAAAAGREYIAITDHSRALAMARGLDEAQLAEHAAEVARIDAQLAGDIRVLRGIEVDILRDGALDLAADALAELDVVIGSMHSHLGLPKDEMTARLVAAIESRALDVVGHPTGRILLHRDASALDMEQVLEAAARHGVAMEVSATPDRLDLAAENCRRAKELGIKLVISTDAHAVSHYRFLRYGVANARRGWIEAADVVNTRGPDDFLRLLHDGHR